MMETIHDESIIRKWKTEGHNLVAVLIDLSLKLCMELEFEEQEQPGPCFLVVARLNGITFGLAKGRDKKTAKYKCCVKTIQALLKNVSHRSNNFRYLLRNQKLPEDLKSELLSLGGQTQKELPDQNFLPSQQQPPQAFNFNLPDFDKVVTMLRKQHHNSISLVYEIHQLCQYNPPQDQYVSGQGKNGDLFLCQVILKEFDIKCFDYGKNKKQAKTNAFQQAVDRLRHMYGIL